MERLWELVKLFLTSHGRMRRYRRALSGFIAVVVFVTTYALILPAITLDAQNAEEQPGIVLEHTSESGEESEADDRNETAAEDLPAGEKSAEELSPEKTSAEETPAQGSSADEANSKDDERTGANDNATDADGSEASEQASDAAEALITEPTTLTFEGEGYSVTASFDGAAGFPEGVEMQVTEIRSEVTAAEHKKDEQEAHKEEEAYRDYYDQALDTVRETQDAQKCLSQARFFDITFVKDGQAYEPKAPVDIRFTYDHLKKDDELIPSKEETVTVLHFDEHEEAFAEVDADHEVSGRKDAVDITFAADSFSVYGIIYTVDFHWEANGKTFDYSIPGGGVASFSTLVKQLGIAADDPATEKDELQELLNGVEGLAFSDPALVSVSKIEETATVGAIKDRLGLSCTYSAELTEEQIAEIDAQTLQAGDWALLALQPFDTEETLTVTMKNGDEWTLRVTDAQISTHVITADGADYLITVTFGENAGIPEDAELTAAEIPQDSQAYASYLQQAEKALGIDENDAQTAEKPWTTRLSFARFFDISILADGEEIEPTAPVDVEIEYVGAENAQLGAMSVIHFADTGIEVLEGITIGTDDSTSVSFSQGSFSVTGTVINSADLSEDDYYIIRESNGRWYALASDGSTVDVTDYYDPTSSSVVNYDGNKNITWEVSFSNGENDGGNGWYNIKAKGENRYISLADNNSLVSGSAQDLFLQGTTWANNQGIWIHYYTEPAGFGFKDQYHHMLSWDWYWNSFTSDNHWVKRDFTNPYVNDWNFGDQYPSEVRFARVTSNSDVVNPNYPNNTYNEAQIQAWLDQAMNDKALQDVSKTATIVDYDNRIYQVDFSARSGVIAMESDLSLAFVTDVSNSMLFPSKLTKVDGKTNIDLTTGNLDSLPHNNGQVYFTIADADQSATVYALYYDNGWKAMDSSFYARWKAGVKKVGNDNNYDYVKNRQKTIDYTATYLHDHDKNSKYTIYTSNPEWFDGIRHKQIYDMTDNGAYGLQEDGSMTSYNMGNRLYYLESSVASAVNDMKIIAKEYPLGAVYAGLETFAENIKSTQNYLPIGGYSANMDTANAQYEANNQKIFNALKDLKGFDGTNQKDAFNGVPNIRVGQYGTNLPNGTKKVVVMITDGAPNKCTKEEAIDAANALKRAGYTVVTIGLSTNEVKVAPEMLWKSASFVDPNVNINSTDKSKDKYYYYAESGEDLKWILRDLVRTMMGRATVTSTVTDKIDPLFYPVDKDGNPFSETAVSYIRKDGSKCSASDPERVGKVEYKNHEWTVTWDHQNIPWEGWNSSIFVKAKEDFLGGNSASTNTEASLVPESYTTKIGTADAKTGNFTEQQKQEKTIRPATPYVNVDELKLTRHSTTHIVYLGEEVTPKEEITGLWNEIVVNTVVDQNGMNDNHTMKSKDSMYYDPNRANKVTADNNTLNNDNDPVTKIPLSHYIPNAEELIEDLLSRIKDGKTESSVSSDPIDYAPYGQSKMGTITVTLTKKVNDEAKDSAPDQHETEKILNAAETYTLTVEYKPLTGEERKQLLTDSGKIDAEDQGYMHSGDNGPGKEVNPTDDEVKSENIHKIIVFAKGLQITKKDETFNKVLKGARFVLYRTARDGESNQEELKGVTGKYVKVADLDASQDGYAVKDPVQKLKTGEKYYLVETQAPEGYLGLDHPIEVLLEIEDHYYPAGTGIQFMTEHEGTAAPEAALYNWAQKATLTLADDPSVRRTEADGTGDITHEGLDPDSEVLRMYYSIANNPGAELPAAGGPGTTLYTLLGTLLAGFAGAFLLLKQKHVLEN